MSKQGHLVVIGGAEERQGEKAILSRFVELSGGKRCQLVVLTTASRSAEVDPAEARAYEELYEGAFRDCGAKQITTLHIHDREAAHDPMYVETVAKASGIFMTGGDQSRLSSILGGTPVHRAMLEAFRERGACVSGTSAGASALSEHMMAGGPSEIRPAKGLVPLAVGLGFLPHVVIDQHFSERQRLPRLIAVIAQNPALLGIGLDEDTGLVVGPDADLEVIGSGTVTILDGRHLVYSTIADVERGEVPVLSNIQLHLLPAGFRFQLHAQDETPPLFQEVLGAVVAAR